MFIFQFWRSSHRKGSSRNTSMIDPIHLQLVETRRRRTTKTSSASTVVNWVAGLKSAEDGAMTAMGARRCQAKQRRTCNQTSGARSTKPACTAATAASTAAATKTAVAAPTKQSTTSCATTTTTSAAPTTSQPGQRAPTPVINTPCGESQNCAVGCRCTFDAIHDFEDVFNNGKPLSMLADRGSSGVFIDSLLFCRVIFSGSSKYYGNQLP